MDQNSRCTPTSQDTQNWLFYFLGLQNVVITSWAIYSNLVQTHIHTSAYTAELPWSLCLLCVDRHFMYEDQLASLRASSSVAECSCFWYRRCPKKGSWRKIRHCNCQLWETCFGVQVSLTHLYCSSVRDYILILAVIESIRKYISKSTVQSVTSRPHEHFLKQDKKYNVFHEWTPMYLKYQ